MHHEQNENHIWKMQTRKIRAKPGSLGRITPDTTTQ